MTDSAVLARPATVVLVHGAWHGAWCWATLQAELDRRGVASFAVDLPGHGVSTAGPTGLHGHAAHLSTVLDRLAADGSGPVLLVGHSYGGAVITQAAAGRHDIGHLVYVAAFAVGDGESVMSTLGSMPRHKIELSAAMVPALDGSSTTLDPDRAPAVLYGGCTPEVVAAALPRLCPQTVSSMTEPARGDPRRTVESTYVVCGRDRAVHPEHQALMADRCTHRIELDTDHSPFLSAVDDMADIVEAASRAIAATESVR